MTTFGSLCSGAEMLGMGIEAVLGPLDHVWYAEPELIRDRATDPWRPNPCLKVLSTRFPGVPNLGDITVVDWSTAPPVDVLAAGFPCQDVSGAGLRLGLRAGTVIPAGLLECGCQWGEHTAKCRDTTAPATLGASVCNWNPDNDGGEIAQAIAWLNARDLADPSGPPPERVVKGTRTGIWLNIAIAIGVLRPRLVLLENVEGLHSAKADSDVEPCPWCVGDPVNESVLRASGAVLGHLSDLGYDARWVTVPASDVGAPHRRKRVFIAAYPADTESLRHWIAGPEGGQGVPTATVGSAVRPDGMTFLPTPRATRGGSTTETTALLPTPAAADADRTSISYVRGNPTLVGALLPTPRVTDGTGAGQHGSGGLDLRTAVALLPTPKSRDHKSPGPSEADRNSPALSAITLLLPTPRATDGSKGGPNQRGSSGDLMLPSAVMLLPTPTVADARGTRNATAGRSTVKPATNNDGWTLSDIAFAERWGEYAPAIARWEQVIGRPAPEPTELGTKGQPRLSPRFVEWMLGLPAGWVCDVPGISRNDQLRILGNGVVWQQAAYAYRWLLDL